MGGELRELEHSAERLPHFEQFLDQLRADGNRIGLWAALMRCEKPSEIGLTEDQMLKKADGTPVVWEARLNTSSSTLLSRKWPRC